MFDDFVRLALKGLKRGTADGQFFLLFIGHGENGDGRSLLSDKMWSKSITQLVSTRKLSNQQLVLVFNSIGFSCEIILRQKLILKVVENESKFVLKFLLEI